MVETYSNTAVEEGTCSNKEKVEVVTCKHTEDGKEQEWA